jgi:pyruvate dehydrogenase E1 component alpha subunit
MSYFGDGASSEGDSHEALNLAGVTRSPVVFVLQNNGWAISTPRSKQSAAEALAYRARGYGFPGVVVDGNDLFAVYEAARTAAERARDGGGPTLIEAQTYRLGAHNTADDATRYMDDAELEQWREQDPIIRVQRYLAARGLWNEDTEAQLRGEVENEVDTAIEAAESVPSPHIDQVFNHVYAEPPARVRRQYQRAREALGDTHA